MDRLECSLPTCPPGSTTTGYSERWIPHETTRGQLYYYLEASIYRIQNVDEYIAGRQNGQGTAVTTEVGGPIVSPLSNALVAISLEAEKDVPNLNFEIVDQAFVQTIKNGYRIKQ